MSAKTVLKILPGVALMVVLAVLPYLSLTIPGILPGRVNGPGSMQLLATCLVFAGFALYVWWRFVRDEWLREQRPEEYFYFEGEYYYDEAAGRYYYYDPEAGEYYWFDDQPGARAGEPSTHDRTQDRTGAHHD